MQNKFTEEFERVTDGEFPELKLKSATYERATGMLTVRFMISAFDARSLVEERRQRVESAVADICPGVAVKAEFIRTYADEGTVRNKILEYFNAHNRLVTRALSSDSVSVKVDEHTIYVTLALETSLCDMLRSSDALKDLSAFLDNNFNQSISVSLKETADAPAPDLDLADSVVVKDSAVRLISAVQGDKVYARGKIAGIAHLPGYICDIKSAADNVVLCGRISGLTKRTYRNKKHDPNDPKTGPEELPMIKFFLDDTTGRMDCVCFPRPDDAPLFDKLQDRDEVLCAGKVTISTYNGAPGLAIDAIFHAEIDFSSVKAAPSKSAPAKYSVIKPAPFEDKAVQTDLFEDGMSKETPAFLMGKTFVVFDFEATGLDIASIEPIEIGAAKVKDGKVVETFNTLLDPKCHIPEEVVKTTSITDDMVKGMPTFSEVLPDFFKFTRGAVLVGHNISGYDFPLLNKYASAAGYIFDNELEDTILLARKYLPDARHYGLEALSKSLGITHINAHRAMGDVFATVELLKIIAAKL